MTSIQIDRLDGLTSSVAYKGPVRVATTANITLTGLKTVDGVALKTGDRILVKDQASGRENGIYVVDTGPWRRSRDFNKTRDVVRGTRVVVNEGSANSGLEWEVVTNNPIKVGTTIIQWRIVAGSAGSGGTLIFATKAQMDAYLAANPNTVAQVVADPTPANNGLYQKQGASGSGSWTRLSDLPGSVIRLLNSGTGTANAIVAATGQPVNGNPLRSIYLLNITAANTGNVTLSVNGQASAAVLDNLGAQLRPGYLKPGMLFPIAWDGTAYRSVSDASTLMIEIENERDARIAADLEERNARIAGDSSLSLAISDERDQRIEADNLEKQQRIDGDKSVASLIGQAGPIEVPLYDTRTAASLANIKPTIQTVRTAGDAAADDGRGGLYNRVSALDPLKFGFQNVHDNSYWQWVDEGREPDNAMFKRRPVKQFPFYNDDLIQAISTYNYSFLYPQSFAIDELTDEIFICHAPSVGGDNLWQWICVYDFRTGVHKSTFTLENTSTLGREGLEVIWRNGDRYLITPNNSGSLIKYDITTLPTSVVQLTPELSLSISARGWLAFDGGSRLYIQDMYQDGNASAGVDLRNRLKIVDVDTFDIVGNATLPVGVTGTLFGNYEFNMPKVQGMSFYKGKMYFGTGGVYDTSSTIPEVNVSKLQGLQQTDLVGNALGSALCDPNAHRAGFSSFLGRVPKVTESEGLAVAYGKLFQLFQTISASERMTIGRNGGIVICEELSASPDAIDYSSAGRALNRTFNKQQYLSRIRTGTSVLTCPITGVDLNSISTIIDMMLALDFREYKFLGTNQPITDINGNSLQAEIAGCIVTVQVAATSAHVFIQGARYYRHFTVAPLSGTRSQINDVALRNSSGEEIYNGADRVVSRYYNNSQQVGGIEVVGLQARHIFNSVGCFLSGGNGNPEGQIAAPIGSLWVHTGTGALYRKTSGTGSTGWVTP